MKRFFYIFSAFLALSACTKGVQEENAVEDDALVINVGGAGLDILSSDVENGQAFTKADAGLGYVPAETIEWLLPPLFHGLEVRYGLKDGDTQIAKLRLNKKDGATGETSADIKKAANGLAVYTLKYLDSSFQTETTNALWRGNGEHVFQGVYVPDAVRESGSSTGRALADNLTTDQSGANYTSLIHYLAMPANTRINATTGRIILPYGHRLGRVLAYVLIDPAMGSGVQLQGFHLDDEGKDDPHTTLFRFNNVKVLDYVRQSGQGTENEKLTPHWVESRKVIPHFDGMRDSRNSRGEKVAGHFMVFTRKSDKHDIFPTNDALWTTAKTAWEAKFNDPSMAGKTDAEKIAFADKESGYVRTDYGQVPCYDLIVRPTYTSAENVLYDEAGVTPSDNKIDFELTLNTGLSYTKSFKFRLNANYQTVVFLKINHEAVDYNEAGSDKWVETVDNDGYYGVNNRNDNALSKTGSSWQRAYRIGENSKNWNVTDGHYYDKPDTTDPLDSENPAQYVTKDKWMELFSQACMLEDPDNPGTLVPGKYHGDYFILDQDITIDLMATESGNFPKPFIFTGHLDCQDHKITLTNAGIKIFTPGKEEAWKETTDYTLPDLRVKVPENEYIPFTLPAELYILEGGVYEKVEGLDIESFMNSSETYYEKSGENYVEFPRPVHLYVWYPGEFHFTPDYLFSGLNGAYEAEAGTANVYIQNGKLVPYVDNESKTGWRAEILNARVSGGKLFPDEAYDPSTGYDVDFVSGYVFNCWRIVAGESPTSVKIPDHIPALPVY